MVAVQTGVYGADRESAVLVKPTAVAPPRGVDEINELRYTPEDAPAFVQHFVLRFALGANAGIG